MDVNAYSYRIHSLLDDKQFDKAIAEANSLISKIDGGYSNPCYYVGLYLLAHAECEKAFDLDQEDEDYENKLSSIIQPALEHIDAALNLYEGSGSIDDSTYECFLMEKAIILTKISQSKARRLFIRLMATIDADTRVTSFDGYKTSTNYLMSFCFHPFGGDFLIPGKEEIDGILNDEELSAEEKDYMINGNPEHQFVKLEQFSNRQFIFFVKDIGSIAGCYDENEVIQWVFTLDQIPYGLTFPVGHPQANTLYVAHPAKPGFYLPYENAENVLFHDKVNDFIRLSQALGAVRISFDWIKGEMVSENIESNFDADAGYKKRLLFNTTAAYSNNSSTSSKSSTNYSMKKELVFDPIKKPYIPDDIVWLDVEPTWQKFVKQRNEGNTLKFSMVMSSSESISLTSSRRDSLKVSFENLMNSANSNFNKKTDKTFSSNVETEWQVCVEFRSLKDFDTKETIVNKLTDTEQAFMDEVKFCLEEGDNISETDYKYLERKRVKLNISQERANQIIEMVQPQLTQSEKEYIETFRELVEDKNDISPRVRRMLDREADSLGIDEKRKLQLESI